MTIEGQSGREHESHGCDFDSEFLNMNEDEFKGVNWKQKGEQSVSMLVIDHNRQQEQLFFNFFARNEKLWNSVQMIKKTIQFQVMKN